MQMINVVRIVTMVGFFGGLTLNGISCATSPLGRRQLKLVPEATMASLGVSSFNQMKETEPVSQNPAAKKYVQCLADALTAELEGKWRKQKWEVVVFDSESVNAFALPGGKIGVYQGIMNVAETAGQLAAVMGHEVGHVLAGHGNERVSQNMVAQGVIVSAGIFTSGDKVLQQNIMGALGLGAQIGVMLPFSRKHESESDLIGVDLMAKAGFHPSAAAELWRNMVKNSSGQPPQFMSTHPSHQTRIKALVDHQPQAMIHYNQARKSGKKPNCTRPD